MTLRRYEPQKKFLAVSPQAFFELFMEPPAAPAPRNDRDCSIVDVRGPLDQHAGGWCDSYDAIKARVSLAAADPETHNVVLCLDSPGGDAAGCFELARDIRKICADNGKPLYAYVDGKACSAAYAIAAAAQTIVIGDSALVGSVGVISTRDDISAMNAARGIRVAMITSGARKADGHPDAPITEDELAAAQTIVDSMAEVFFGLVADMRPLKFESPAAVGGLNAGVFHGASAIQSGLADRVMSLDAMLDELASGGNLMAKSKYEEARAALEETAKGKDANAAAAKRALAALDDNGGDPGAEGGPEEPKTEEPVEEGDDAPPKKKDDDKEPDASDDTDEPDAAGDDDGDEPAAIAARSGASAELNALAEVQKLRAEIAADKDQAERKRLLASRPDFTPEMIKALRTAPMKTVREFCSTLPRAPRPKPAATATVAATRGASQGGSAPEPASAVTEMDRAMGLTTTTLGVRREGHQLVFGVQEKRIERAAVSGTAGGAK